MRSNRPGYFITLEGGEGGGKTSHIFGLVEHLRSNGFKVCSTREPGGDEVGEKIGEILRDKKNLSINKRTETLLFQAARSQFVDVVTPLLKDGWVVISDRYADSTIAYQGFGHEQDVGVIKTLIRFATDGLVPDLTVLFDLDPEIGIARKRDQGKLERMDTFPMEFHKRVRKGYLDIFSRDSKRFILLDASKSKSEVFNELLVQVDKRLNKANFLEKNSRRIEG